MDLCSGKCNARRTILSSAIKTKCRDLVKLIHNRRIWCSSFANVHTRYGTNCLFLLLNGIFDTKACKQGFPHSTAHSHFHIHLRAKKSIDAAIHDYFESIPIENEVSFLEVEGKNG